MAKKDWAMPSDVSAVHAEIEVWREKRQKRGPVPSSIWLAATALAKRYNVYRISQALRLNYGALKRRLLEPSDELEALSKDNIVSGGHCEFVELSGVGPLGVRKAENVANETKVFGDTGPFGMEIEVSDNSGSRMTVRVMENSVVDIPTMLSAFWGRV